MLPIGPLMIEHRLIERMIALAKHEADRVAGGGRPDARFVLSMVDFMRSYADRTHHGKEEDILFRDLTEQNLTDEHSALMQELVNEHVRARALVGALEAAGLEAETAPDTRGGEVVRALREIVGLYPQHIEKEDRRFFPAAMEYFTDAEKDAMLDEFYEFDRTMVHEAYGRMVERYEDARSREDDKNAAR
jgi:hemerythrin-like domain-containing protein